jgi:hypothetical protein
MSNPGWFSHAQRIAFPFDPFPVVHADDKKAVVDAQLVDDEGDERILLYALTLSGGDYSIMLKYDDDSVFYSGSCTSIAMGVYTVISFEDDKKRGAFTLHTDTLGSAWSLTGGPYYMATRTVDVVPLNVSSVQVEEEEDDATVLTTIEGDVEFSAGYNMEIDVEDTTSPIAPVREATPITFNAVGGAGLGNAPDPDCTGNTSVYVRSINGVKPDNFGNFLLVGKGCYQVSPPIEPGDVVTMTVGSLKIVNNCVPCCSCVDYGDLYEEERDLYRLAKTIGNAMTYMLYGVEGADFGPGHVMNLSHLNEEMEKLRDRFSKRRFKVRLRPQAGGVVGVLLTLLNNPTGREYDMTGTGADGDLELTFSADDAEVVSATFTKVLDTARVYHESTEEWYNVELDELFDFSGDAPELSTLTIQLEASKGDPTVPLHIIPPTQYVSLYFEVQFMSGWLTENYALTLTTTSVNEQWESPDSMYDADGNYDLEASPTYTYEAETEIRLAPGVNVDEGGS